MSLNIFLIVFIIWNLIVLIVYGIDKYKASRNRWRIKESLLLILAFLFGGIGGFLGSKIFHHKTQKLKFKVLLPVFIGVNILVIIYFITIGWLRV